jgi:hypothetical protein
MQGRRKLTYTIGDIYNNMQVTDYNRKKNYYQVSCIECGELFEVQSINLKDDKNHCKNINCRLWGKAPKNEYLVGEIKHNLKCLRYVYTEKKPNVRSLEVQCQICGTKFICDRIHFLDSLVACVNKKCSNSCNFLKDMEIMKGMETPKLHVLYDIDNKFVQAECKLCKAQFKLIKTSIRSGRGLCKNKDCLYSRTDRQMQSVGSVQGDFKILDRLEVNKYLCECTVCGHKEYKEKAPTYNERCVYHPHAYKKFEGLFNNFAIEANAYTYKEKDYFICSCTKCGYRDILTASEMLQHQCEERNFKNE